MWRLQSFLCSSVMAALSLALVTSQATEWDIPVGTWFSGNNITARSETHNTKDIGRSYIDLGIPISPGVLQAFQYYIYNPYGTTRPQRAKFLVWELQFQEFTRQTNQLYNSSIILKYELAFTVGMQTGVYTVPVADRPNMKAQYFLGFSTTDPVIPFTFDYATQNSTKKVVPTLELAAPNVGDTRTVQDSDGERVIYSIGAIIDPELEFNETGLGSTGSTGVKGIRGITGAPGLNGVDGADGEPGLPGLKGEPGVSGEIGPAGLSGAAGDPGAPGEPGLKGLAGDQSLAGLGGADAFAGEIGATGSLGAPGPKGAIGDIGALGQQGIKGEVGDRGLPGVTGERGLKGLQGASGFYGSHGRVGNTGLQGPTGEKGEQGVTGFAGAVGPKGARGDQGAQGIKGDTGAPGDKGVVGDPGVDGRNGKFAVTINECSTNNGGCSDVCLNTLGGYYCACDKGYVLRPAPTLSCDPGTVYCDSYLHYGKLCYCQIQGIVNPMNGTACQDINECAVNNGHCEQVCTNTPGSHSCSCDPGYALSRDERRCQDINECQENADGCAEICVNTIGGYYCGCPANKEGSQSPHPAVASCVANTGGKCERTKDYRTICYCHLSNNFAVTMGSTGCQPRDECSKNNGGCSHICTNTANGHECSCFPPPSGWKYAVWQLSTNGYDCLDIDECAISSVRDRMCRSETHYCINKPGYWYCMQKGLIGDEPGAMSRELLLQGTSQSALRASQASGSGRRLCFSTMSTLAVGSIWIVIIMLL